MKFNIITISREHGSGGRLIAKRLSEMLSIPLYDKQLIEMSAKDSGFTEQFIKETEQKRTTSFLNFFEFSKMLFLGLQKKYIVQKIMQITVVKRWELISPKKPKTKR